MNGSGVRQVFRDAVQTAGPGLPMRFARDDRVETQVASATSEWRVSATRRGHFFNRCASLAYRVRLGCGRSYRATVVMRIKHAPEPGPLIGSHFEPGAQMISTIVHVSSSRVLYGSEAPIVSGALRKALKTIGGTRKRSSS